MTNPADSNPDEITQSSPPAPPQQPAAVDLESGAPRNGETARGGVTEVVQRWKREDIARKVALASHGLAFVFSVLAFVLMASNDHGDWKDFDKYEEYRYVTAIAILSSLYTLVQGFRHCRELSSGTIFTSRNVALIDFFGDQILAYLLLSASSAAVPITNSMREGADNIFTDQSSAAISMSFFAFFAMAVSAIITGYKLSKQNYI